MTAAISAKPAARKKNSPTGVQKAANRAAAERSPGQGQRRRRSGDPGRQRDPARTRELILNAASEEFGSVGFEAARVARIAERAGVAQQMISYHFGGKRGLFEALSERWIDSGRSLNESTESVVDMLGELIHRAADESAWAQALVLDGQGIDHANLVERLAPILDDVRSFQAQGKLPADIDAGIFAFMMFALTLAPTAFPHIARAFSVVDPGSPDFTSYYARQVQAILNLQLRRS
ncbi:TetR/AcrR family transcriptional regulator [Mycolicibacterium sp. CBM1]